MMQSLEDNKCALLGVSYYEERSSIQHDLFRSMLGIHTWSSCLELENNNKYTLASLGSFIHVIFNFLLSLFFALFAIKPE